MIELRYLTKRNCKVFFHDKGMLLTAMITPLILLVLYATFLANVYRDSFATAIPAGFPVAESLIDAIVGGQLTSSLLAVSCVTVAFSSNLLMVQDKMSGARRDLMVSPAKKSTLAVSYFLATWLVTLAISFVALGACLIYLSGESFYLSGSDVWQLVLDVTLLSSFGTVLSSIVNMHLSTQGQISAVSAIISAGYGFICGAYMPISSFGDTMQKIVSFLPGTYGTSLLRNHAMNGVFAEMSKAGFPAEAVKGIRDSVDANLYFFDQEVAMPTMYLILAGSIVLLLGGYILLNLLRKGKR